MNDVTHDPPLPLPIRVGDLSLDGFPDLIIIVASAPEGGILGVGASIDRTPYILSSVPCARGIAGCNESGQGRRGFAVASTGSEALRQIVDARGVTVLDLDEDVCCHPLPLTDYYKQYAYGFVGNSRYSSTANRRTRQRD